MIGYMYVYRKKNIVNFTTALERVGFTKKFNHGHNFRYYRAIYNRIIGSIQSKLVQFMIELLDQFQFMQPATTPVESPNRIIY